jgi:hypothetical protein
MSHTIILLVSLSQIRTQPAVSKCAVSSVFLCVDYTSTPGRSTPQLRTRARGEEEAIFKVGMVLWNSGFMVSWIFGFSDSIGTSGKTKILGPYRCPSVGTLGSSDSFGVWRCQVPVESEDPGVPKIIVYLGFTRVVWYFRFSF